MLRWADPVARLRVRHVLRWADPVARLAEHAFDEAVVLTPAGRSPLPVARLLRAAGIRQATGPDAALPADLPEPERALAVAEAAGYRLPPSDDGRSRSAARRRCRRCSGRSPASRTSCCTRAGPGPAGPSGSTGRPRSCSTAPGSRWS
ncbi:hypothetical protein BJF78_35415 [Pseudonocardia sp. CNS-139]|nr:hypothetical protein BJF78_35415 [Pseudonocardia sp. CNS-139]